MHAHTSLCRTCTPPAAQAVTRCTRARRRPPPRATPPDQDAASASTSSSSSSSSVLDPAFAQELIKELQDPAQRGQRGEGWTIAQFAALACVLLPPFHATELVSGVGVLLLLGGAGAIALALQDLGTALTPLPAPRENAQLVTTGVYGFIRHPMYGGLLMAALGIAAVSHDESRLLAAAVLWLVLERKTAFEEALLTQRYGQAYSDYQGRVAKFLPWLY